MKFSRVRNVVLGMLVMALMMTVAIPAMASVRKQTIDVDYVDIKLVVNGKEVTPKDANGNVVEPFAYNGTTYLPVRAVGEALGKSVRWEGETKTVHLGELPQATYLVDACKVAEGRASYVYRAADHKAFELGGKRYSQGFTPSAIAFDLGGKYESLTFDYSESNPYGYDVSVDVYLDGELAQTIKAVKDDGVRTVTVPLNYAQTVCFSGSGGYVANAVLNGERAVTKPVPPANATYLVDVCEFYTAGEASAARGTYFTDIFGNQYTNGIGHTYLPVKLNGRYKTLKATIFVNKHGESHPQKTTCTFWVDGEPVKEIKISPIMPPQAIEIPLNYGMELEFDGDWCYLTDAILE